MTLLAKLTLVSSVFLVAASGVIYVSLQKAAPTATTPGADDWKPFIAFAGVPLTFLTSLATAVISVVVALEQRETSLRVERLKDALSGTRKAYDALLAAASSYYHLLSALATGEWDLTRVQTVEQAMAQAEGSLKDIPQDARQSWYDFWSKARFIAESAKNDATLDGRRQLWNDEAKNFGALYQNLVGWASQQA